MKQKYVALFRRLSQLTLHTKEKLYKKTSGLTLKRPLNF